MRLNGRAVPAPALTVTILMVGITLLTAFLLTDGEQRGGGFWVSLAGALVAGFAVGLSPILTSARDAEGVPPWQLGLMQGPILYAAAVVGLVLLALLGFSWRWLLIGHLLAVSGLAVWLVAGRTLGAHVAQTGRVEEDRRSDWTALRDQFGPIHEYLRRLGASVAPELRAEVARLEDDLRYAPPSGTPESHGVEMEIVAIVRRMPGLLAGGAGADWESLRLEIQIARDLVRRRTERIANSRREYR